MKLKIVKFLLKLVYFLNKSFLKNFCSKKLSSEQLKKTIPIISTKMFQGHFPKLKKNVFVVNKVI